MYRQAFLLEENFSSASFTDFNMLNKCSQIVFQGIEEHIQFKANVTVTSIAQCYLVVSHRHVCFHSASQGLTQGVRMSSKIHDTLHGLLTKATNFGAVLDVACSSSSSSSSSSVWQVMGRKQPSTTKSTEDLCVGPSTPSQATIQHYTGSSMVRVFGSKPVAHTF